MAAITQARQRGARPVTWVQIGSAAGDQAAMSAVALRSTSITLVGSGQGSVPLPAILAELPDMMQQIVAGRITVPYRTVPLTDVAAAWDEAETSDTRIVLAPAGADESV